MAEKDVVSHLFDSADNPQILTFESISSASHRLRNPYINFSDHVTVFHHDDDISSPFESTIHVDALEEEDAVSDPESVIVDASEAEVFTMDLFPEHPDESRAVRDAELATEELIEEGGEIGMERLELDLGLRLNHSCHPYDNRENNRFVVENNGFVDNRENSRIDRNSIGFGSDSEDEDGENGSIEIEVDLDTFEDDENRSISVCWDSLRLDDPRESYEDIGWEDVDERVETLSVLVDAEDEEGVPVETMDGLGNLEWEVLLNVGNLDRNLETELEGDIGEIYFGDNDDYIYTAEYETLVGQFVESESSLMGKPPASKTVVENLLSVVMTQDDLEKNIAFCAICKDDIIVGDTAKKLPCAHRYHGDCIIPWLGIRNTCPVCRYELPTDDSDYEQRRVQRVGLRR